MTRLVLGPVAALLGSKRLAIVADGALEYVPFAALPNPLSNRLLIADHEIASLPSASALAILRQETGARKPAPRTVAVLADPVFRPDDPRTIGARAAPAVRSGGERAGGSLARLPGTRREAAAILAQVPSTARKQAFDFDASRATATSAELASYRIVHFATHAVLDTEHPELSGVVLSLVNKDGSPQDGFLRLHDIYNLKLPVEMVVLSACQTALGKEIRGEGLVGLTRGFMYAGAPRVVASLWKVDDKATAELMKRFYQGMLGSRRLAPAAALRAAQIEVSRQKQWQAPYYWAAFVLQGEWRGATRPRKAGA